MNDFIVALIPLSGLIAFFIGCYAQKKVGRLQSFFEKN